MNNLLAAAGIIGGVVVTLWMYISAIFSANGNDSKDDDEEQIEYIRNYYKKRGEKKCEKQ